MYEKVAEGVCVYEKVAEGVCVCVKVAEDAPKFAGRRLLNGEVVEEEMEANDFDESIAVAVSARLSL